MFRLFGGSSSYSSSRDFNEVENLGSGDCAYFSLAIGIMPYLKQELENGNTLIESSIYGKIASFIREHSELKVDMVKFDQQIRAYTMYGGNERLQRTLNVVLRKMLAEKRLADCQKFLEDVENNRGNPAFRLDEQLNKNMVMNDLRGAMISLYTGYARVGGNTEVERHPETMAALREINKNIKEFERKQYNLSQSTIHQMTHERLLQSYLQLLSFEDPEFGRQALVAKGEDAVLASAGKKILLESLFNYYQQDNFIDATGQGVINLTNYLNNLNKARGNDFLFTHTQQELLSALISTYFFDKEIDLLSEENRESCLITFKLSNHQYKQLCKEVKRLARHFKDLMVVKDNLPDMKCFPQLIHYGEFTKIGLQHFLREITTKCDTRPSISEEFIRYRLSLGVWGTDSDIRELCDMLEVEPHFATFEQARGSNPYVVYLNNISNYHWRTRFYNSPVASKREIPDRREKFDIPEESEPNDFLDSNFDSNGTDFPPYRPEDFDFLSDHSKGLDFSEEPDELDFPEYQPEAFDRPKVTLKADYIKALFELYIDGNWSFFCFFNSRHHLDKAKQIIELCKTKSVPEIMDSILEMRKSIKKINLKGDFAMNVDHLCRRMYGKDFLEYQKELTQKGLAKHSQPSTYSLY